MTPEQFQSLRNAEPIRHIQSSDFKDGTLLFGYTTDRNDFHVYKQHGLLHVVIYAGNHLVSYKSYLDAEGSEFNPGKRVYPEHTSYEFAYALMYKANVHLSFSSNLDAPTDIKELKRYEDFKEVLVSSETLDVITSEFFYLYEEFVPNGNEIIRAYFKLDNVSRKTKYVTDIDGNTYPITDFMTVLLEIPKVDHPDLIPNARWLHYINALVVEAKNTVSKNFTRPVNSDMPLPTLQVTEDSFSQALNDILQEHSAMFDESVLPELTKANELAQERLGSFIFGKLESIKPEASLEYVVSTRKKS